MFLGGKHDDGTIIKPGPRGHDVYPAIVAGHCPSRRASDPNGFVQELFDFSFSSFVTPAIIRVRCALTLIVAVLAAFVYTIPAFSEPGFPLFIIVVVAFWQLFLLRKRDDRKTKPEGE